MMAVAPILLVEDNPDDVELTLRAFRRSRVANDVVVARDGVEAMERLLSQTQPRPALILLDLKLPRVDGFELLRWIREDEVLRVLPVVILTSSKEERDIVQSYTLGANSYIVKPVDFEKFNEVVDQLGMYWMLLNQGATGGPPA
ncbi:MAG: response regulator [Gemmatimonadetes bacterium]|nr:response regulator [Gemmatimonadota bacterium]